MPSHKPLSLEQLRKIRKPVRNINIEHREKLSKLDNLALWVTVRVGTMGFFLIIMAWTFIWLGWNILAPSAWSFDPYPAFVLWLFISNMIQILLMPLSPSFIIYFAIRIFSTFHLDKNFLQK